MRNTNRRNAARRNASSTTIESLEARQLLSASLQAPSLPGGAYFVNVNGSQYSDIINVSVSAAFFGNVVTVQENLTTTGSWFVPGGNHFAIQVFGKGGDDTITVKAGTESTIYVNGGEGNDTITTPGAAPAYLHGGNGNDLLTSGSGNDLLYGEGGSDVLKSNAGDDTLFGGSQPWNDWFTDRDVLDGGDGRDVLFASMLGDNVLLGGRGNDDLYGSIGNDLLNGGPGPLRVFGYLIDADSDLLVGGGGIDTADYSARTDNLNISLDDVRNDGAAGEYDNVVGCAIVKGGAGADTFSGKYATTFYGGAGHDTYNLKNGVSDTVFDDVANSTFNTDSSDWINPAPRRIPTLV